MRVYQVDAEAGQPVPPSLYPARLHEADRMNPLAVIGRLFRVTRESNIQRDLIILVTPHIVRASS